MPDTTPVELYYHGNDVAKGVVPVEYMVDALVGFSGAYAKVARRYTSNDVLYRLRVTGLKEGSSRILVEAFEWAKQNPQLTATAAGLLTAGVAGGCKVVKWIAEYINSKKHLAGAPFSNNNIIGAGAVVNGNVTVILQNNSGQQLPISRETAELLEEQDIDADVDKLTSPLSPDHVDNFVLKLADEPVAEVKAIERPYFMHTLTDVTTTQPDIWVEGFLNSHSKTSNRGTFITLDNKHVPYKYVGRDTTALLAGYGFNGAVRVLANVKFDANMNPIYMSIYDVELKQKVMFTPQ